MPDDSRPISRRVRFEILRRDGHTCRYCGGTAPDVVLTVDHVIPVALGGSNDPSNLVTACRDCNSGKTSTSPDEHVVADVAADALQWAKALTAAAEARRVEYAIIDAEVDQTIKCWDGYTYGDGIQIPREGNWRYSLERFVSVGLDAADMMRMIVVAMGSKARIADKWRYFCGCCWNEVTRRQEMALSSLADTDSAYRPGTRATSGDEPEDEMSSWDDGYDCGYQSGVNAGRRLATEEHLDYDESAYQRGYRDGANRRNKYESYHHEVNLELDPSDYDTSDIDTSDRYE